MQSTLDKESIMFQDFYESILTYIDAYQPSVKETLEFVGALIDSIVDMLDITEEEKLLYINVYTRLIRKKLYLKKMSKEIPTQEPALIMG